MRLMSLVNMNQDYVYVSHLISKYELVLGRTRSMCLISLVNMNQEQVYVSYLISTFELGLGVCLISSQFLFKNGLAFGVARYTICCNLES